MFTTWFQKLAEMDDVVYNLKELLRELDGHVMSNSKSPFNLIQEAIMQFHNTNRISVQTMYSTFTELFNDREVQCLRENAKTQMEWAEEAQRNLLFLQKYLYSASDSLSENYENTITADKVHHILGYIKRLFVVNYNYCAEDIPLIIKHYPSFEIERECKDWNDVTNEFHKVALETATQLLPPSNANLYQFYAQDQKKDALNSTKNYMDRYIKMAEKCSSWALPALENTVNELKSMLDAHHEPITNADAAKETEYMRDIRTIEDDFFLNYFMPLTKLAELDVVEFAQNLTDQSLLERLVPLDKLITMIEQRVYAGLHREIFLEEPVHTTETFMTVLKLSTDVFEYFHPGYEQIFTDRIRQFKIWQKPIPMLESPDLIQYDLSPYDTEKVWAKEVAAASFYKTRAEIVLTRNVKNFFRLLGDELFEIEENLKDYLSQFQKAYAGINKTMSEILEMAEINEEFML